MDVGTWMWGPEKKWSPEAQVSVYPSNVFWPHKTNPMALGVKDSLISTKS